MALGSEERRSWAMNKTILLIVIAALTFGCRKELCYLPHPHPQPIVVAMDWSAAYDGQIPTTVGVYFFPMTKSKSGPEYVFVDVNAPITFYLPAEGGRVNLPVGTYAAIAYNMDTERIMIRNNNKYEDFEAYTDVLTRKSYKLSSNEEITADMPDYLYCDNVDFMQVLPEERDANCQTIRFAPKPAVLRFFVNVKVEGLTYANDYRGAVSNMRGSYFVSQKSSSDRPITMLFDFGKVHNQYIRAEVFAFGAMPTSDDVRNVITVEFLMKDGEVKSFPFDVSAQMDTLHHGQQINLGLNGEIDLPPTSGGEGEFGGGIGGWDDEIIAPLQ